MGSLVPLGEAVRAARVAAGMTIKTLAERSGLSARFLSELEKGRGNISIGRLWAVSRAVGQPLSALVAPLDAVLAPVAPMALVGLRGAGKSTIGERAAARMGRPFVELDALVEAAAGLTLAQLFEIHGEAYYRRLERSAVARVVSDAALEGAVVATGGGIVTDVESWRVLRDRAQTVWLRAAPDDHYQRVMDQGDTRPMANRPRAMAELRALLEARAPLYAQAQVHVDTSALGLDASVDAVIEAGRSRSGKVRTPSSSTA